MENLIIEENNTNILDTIPDRKVEFKTKTADFVSGKGEGRVFLFYGIPIRVQKCLCSSEI